MFIIYILKSRRLFIAETHYDFCQRACFLSVLALAGFFVILYPF